MFVSCWHCSGGPASSCHYSCCWKILVVASLVRLGSVEVFVLAQINSHHVTAMAAKPVLKLGKDKIAASSKKAWSCVKAMMWALRCRRIHCVDDVWSVRVREGGRWCLQPAAVSAEGSQGRPCLDWCEQAWASGWVAGVGVIKIQSMFSVITTFVHKYPSVFVLQSKIQVQFKKAFLGMEQLPIHDIQDMYIHIVWFIIISPIWTTTVKKRGYICIKILLKLGRFIILNF